MDVAGSIAPGSVDYTEELDEDRDVKCDADERIIRYEFLNVGRHGVRLDGLEHREELARLFRAAGFRERGLTTNRPAQAQAVRSESA